MRSFSLGAALGAALVVASCGGREIAPESRSAAAVESDMILASALAHAQSQLELSQLAQQKARTPAIAAYAQRIAAERPPLLAQLAAVAQPRGVTADSNHTPSIDFFKSLAGEAFERAYVATEIEDQQNAIDVLDYAAHRDGDPGLKTLAAAALPQLRQDLVNAIGAVKNIPFETSTDSSEGVIVSPRRR